LRAGDVEDAGSVNAAADSEGAKGDSRASRCRIVMWNGRLRMIRRRDDGGSTTQRRAADDAEEEVEDADDSAAMAALAREEEGKVSLAALYLLVLSGAGNRT
jgi:hypothetical protein